MYYQWLLYPRHRYPFSYFSCRNTALFPFANLSRIYCFGEIPDTLALT